MSLEELLNINPNHITSSDFERFFDKKGLGKVTKKELDRIVDTLGITVFYFSSFGKIYDLVSANDTNRTMGRWTIAIGIMTLFILLMTAAMMYMTYVMLMSSGA